MIKVLLVDDHELVTEGIKGLLNISEGIEVVGIAKNGEEAIQEVKTLLPDVILMDVFMPGIGGIEACRRILSLYPTMKIIGLSGSSEGAAPKQFLQMGGANFLFKHESTEKMLATIKSVAHEESYVFSGLNPSNNKESPFALLSTREAETISLILQGKTLQYIAQVLNLSDKTIGTYRRRGYVKLGIKQDVELARLAALHNYK